MLLYELTDHISSDLQKTLFYFRRMIFRSEMNQMVIYDILYLQLIDIQLGWKLKILNIVNDNF